MLSELETQLQDVMLRDQFRFRRQFAHLKRAERQQRLNEDELLKFATQIKLSIALSAKRSGLHRIPEYNSASLTDTFPEAIGLFLVLNTFLSYFLSKVSFTMQPADLIKTDPKKNNNK